MKLFKKTFRKNSRKNKKTQRRRGGLKMVDIKGFNPLKWKQNRLDRKRNEMMMMPEEKPTNFGYSDKSTIIENESTEKLPFGYSDKRTVIENDDEEEEEDNRTEMEKFYEGSEFGGRRSRHRRRRRHSKKNRKSRKYF